MILTWGKPKLEIVALVNGAIPSNPVWTEITTPKEDSTKLATTKGTKKEAKLEGGAIKDKKYSKSSYALEFVISLGKNEEKPIEDADGVIVDNYAIRLTPEDDTLSGYIIEKASVSVEETWSSADGSELKYTFDALQPAAGNQLKPYTKA